MLENILCLAAFLKARRGNGCLTVALKKNIASFNARQDCYVVIPAVFTTFIY